MKLLSLDPRWWPALTAIYHHLESQPLPRRFARTLHLHVPMNVHKAATLATLIVESAVPLLLLTPFRVLGVGILSSLQMAIVSTGNFGPINILSVAMSLTALRDSDLAFLRLYLQRGSHASAHVCARPRKNAQALAAVSLTAQPPRPS